MVVEFKGGNAVDYIVIKEDLTHGQRIAGWELDIQLGQPVREKRLFMFAPF